MSIFQSLNVIAGLLVIWSSMCALNGMCRKTSSLTRGAYLFLAVGSAAILLAPVYLEREQTLAETLMIWGAAVLTLQTSFRVQLRAFRRFMRGHSGT